MTPPNATPTIDNHVRTSEEIRTAFLDFFQEKDHLLMPSSSLIPPPDDPTLLLTSAGMVQFKPYFMGERRPPKPRLTSVQKCFRVTDVDEVGDASHLTFFEMLGNFSVGDYFKEKAIEWAWEFVTERMKLPKERLWAAIYLDDDEAHDIWLKTGVPEERIRRFDEKENYWGPAGNEGPCGPCSEIHYDFGGTCRHGQAGRRVRPQLRLRTVPGAVEPGVHAVLPGHGRHADSAAQSQHRYRNGPGARRS